MEPFGRVHRLKRYRTLSLCVDTEFLLTMKSGSGNNGNSISGMSAELFLSQDDSLAALVVSHGIKVRDFILLSFLSDQGPMSVSRLARVVGIDPQSTLRGLKRLSSANLVLRNPTEKSEQFESIARLTSRGEETAARISNQLS
jgi:DNA-binding MarR family transcriptional regulator